MHEDILRQFFLNQITASHLSNDLVGSLAESSALITRHPIVDMETHFKVEPVHLIRICDAVLSGEIEAKQLAAIGFCLVASDHFNWDSDQPEGQIVAEVVYDWSAYMINYPLTISNAHKWRHYLKSGENIFIRGDIEDTTNG